MTYLTSLLIIWPEVATILITVIAVSLFLLGSNKMAKEAIEELKLVRKQRADYEEYIKDLEARVTELESKFKPTP